MGETVKKFIPVATETTQTRAACARVCVVCLYYCIIVLLPAWLIGIKLK